jgi:hypothetical protein
VRLAWRRVASQCIQDGGQGHRYECEAYQQDGQEFVDRTLRRDKYG